MSSFVNLHVGLQKVWPNEVNIQIEVQRCWFSWPEFLSLAVRGALEIVDVWPASGRSLSCGLRILCEDIVNDGAGRREDVLGGFLANRLSI